MSSSPAAPLSERIAFGHPVVDRYAVLAAFGVLGVLTLKTFVITDKSTGAQTLDPDFPRLSAGAVVKVGPLFGTLR